MRGLVLGAALLALVACDGGGDTTATRNIAVTGATPYVEQLKALGEANRGLALRRAIQDSGERCKRVDASGYQQDYQNLSMWTARCSDTGDWALFIAPNGDVQVRDCDDAASLELPACRFDEPAAS
ncbi:hypothetical protein [Sphingosinicella humi]|nr:hypothetical protein [Sphingosinicella humi]